MRLLLLTLALAAAGCHLEPEAPAGPAPADVAPAPLAEPARSERPAPLPRQPAADAPAVAPGERDEVVLYVTEWCPYCKQAREYMADQGVPHRVVDIEASAQANAEYRTAGGTGGIPLVTVGDRTIEGWSADLAREMLDGAGYD